MLMTYDAQLEGSVIWSCALTSCSATSITASDENATDDLLTSDAHLHTVGAQEEKFCSILPCLDPTDA